MDPILITIAFVFGFAVKQVGLPPLVGFLTAGFVLNALGIEGGEALQELADIGIILLLFSIGLKLKIKDLLKPQIWASASVHMLITVCVFGLFVYALTFSGLSLFASLDFRLSLLIAFALSFSSTVFAVKVFEEKGEMTSRHGTIAIGILIMQDMFAVVFITLSAGKVPSIWALALLGLIFLRKPLKFLMDRSGHGELMVLLACILPLAGAGFFERVGMKPDLGALIMGVLLSGHPKTDELAKAMLGFKDLFLVGFFLTIGMSGLPDLQALGIASLFLLAVPLKAILFFVLLTGFRLRARTSMLASFSLANYSEFGLIVGATGVANGWISEQWLVIFAVALSISLIAASPFYKSVHFFYEKWRGFLQKFETEKRLPDDTVVDTGDAEIVVFAMGRIGTGAYENLKSRYGDKVIGVDSDSDAVALHTQAGRNVILGDATDEDFWLTLIPGVLGIRRVLLTMSSHEANMFAAKMVLKSMQIECVAAIAQFEDEMDELKDAGVHHVYNFYMEAGAGFSEHVCSMDGI